MSFSEQVRYEISEKNATPEDIRAAIAYGCLLFFYERRGEEGVLITRSQTKAKEIRTLLCEVLAAEVEIFEIHRGKSPAYEVVCRDVGRVLSLFGYPKEMLPEYINLRILKGTELRNAFLAGVFYACGSVNDPEKGYHLEFDPPSDKLCDALANLLEKQEMPLRRSQRRGRPLLYTKESTRIEELLAAFGASKAAIYLMETQVEKAVKNNINRRNNCDTANIGKTMDASLRQNESIKKLMESDRLYDLPEELQQVALLRMANPELSLAELGKLLMPPLSRSGVNHRLQKLEKLAESGELEG